MTNTIRSEFTIASKRIYHVLLNKKKQFLISTIDCGAFLIEKDGKILKHYSSHENLPTDVIFHTYESKNGNLWMATDIGIIKLENAVPIYHLKTPGVRPFKVLSILKNKGLIYFATNNGLYYIKPENKNIHQPKLQCVEGINAPSTELAYYVITKNRIKDTLLLLSSEDGLYLIDGLNIKSLTPRIVISSAHQCKKHPEIILIGTNKGAAFIEYPSIKKININYIKEITSSIGKIIEDENENFWFGSYNNGFYLAHYTNSQFKVVDYHKYIGKNKNNSEFALIKDEKIFFLGSNGLNCYLPQKKSLNQNSSIFPAELDNKNIYLYNYYNDSIQWISYSKNKSTIPIQLINNTIPDYNILFKRLQKEGIFSIYQESKNRVWFGTKNGVFFAENFNLIQTDQHRPIIFFNLIKFKNNKLVCGGSGISNIKTLQQKSNELTINEEISYQNNDIHISVTSPSNFGDEFAQFSFFMEGFDSAWSVWNKQNSRSYRNLKEGKYRLLVKSRNIFEIESDPIILNFRILPPWNRTIIAYITKFLCIIFIIFLLVRYFCKRFEREKIKLERIISERSSKILDQKAEIESQARMLDQINKSLKQLSIVAQKTDNPVIIVNSRREVEWVNDSFYKFFKLPHKEHGQVTINEICINSGIDDKIDVCLLEKKPLSYCVRFDTNLLKEIYFQTTITPVIDKNDNITNLILICSDITNIIELNKTRDIIISVITHDLKSPLLGFRMMSKTLSEHIGIYRDDQIKEKIKVMEKHALTIYNLLEDLTEWFKSQHGLLSFLPDYLKLGELVDDLIKIYTEQIGEKSLKIINDISDTIIVFADEHMVRTILRNLISNSIKFSEKGKINISAEDKIKYIEIIVSDEGKGFSEEVKAKIFSNQFSEGLGLMICKEFVYKNGGMIWIGDDNPGAKVIFTLPTGKSA